MKKVLLAILVTTAWISISEFARNEFLLKQHWINHYAGMGLSFPAEPINGAVWGIWSMVYATVIYTVSTRFNLLQTALLAWVVGFGMMWLVIGNLLVLPWAILPWAIPLSMIEATVATWLVYKLTQ